MRRFSLQHCMIIPPGLRFRAGAVFALAILVSLLVPGSAHFLLARREASRVRHGQAGASHQAGTFKVVVRQVVVDVVVTDRRGHPVKNLRKKDFEVLEDGKAQQIQSFTAHQSLNLSQAALPKIPRLPANTFINLARVPSDAPLNVILLDLGNTPWDDLPYLRQQISKFLRQRRIGARYAVFVMGSGNVGMLQGFTSDKDLLMAAVNSKTNSSFLYQTTASPFGRGMGLVSVYGGMGSGPKGAAAGNDFARNHGLAALGEQGDSPPDPKPTPAVAPKGTRYQHILQIIAGEKVPSPSSRMAAAGKDLANNVQVGNTIGELKQLAAILSGLPGRKNLFWFTGSFPFQFDNLQHVSATTGTVVNINNAPEVYRAARLLETSRTSVYAIDAQGAQVSIPTSKRGKVVQAAGRRIYTEHLVLDAVAKQTGGRAFYSTNGFARAMRTAADEGANFYTLAYSPGNSDFHGELRHIRVKLRKKHVKYHLYYRRTYFANSLDATAWRPSDPLAFTLQHGAPEAHQILFMASLQAVGKPRPATQAEIKALAQGKKPSPQAGKGKSRKHHPLILQTYVVHYGLLPKAVKVVQERTGRHRVRLDFAVRAYDRAGKELARFNSRTRGDISPKTYRQIERHGFRVSENIVVPVNTAYLRLAVLDRLANRVGSMEISLPLTPAKTSANHRH